MSAAADSQLGGLPRLSDHRDATVARRWAAGRAQLNRVVAVMALVVVLPTIAVAERLHRGSGRAVALRAITVVSRLCGVTFEVSGPVGGASPGAVVVAHHASPMDIPAVLSALPGARFVAAADLFRIPLLGAAMRALGTVPVDRRHPEHGRSQLAELAVPDTGAPLAIFPEGAIAPLGEQLPFKAGAFFLAVRTSTPLLPLVITGTDRVLAPRGRLLVRPGVVTVDLLEPLDPVALSIGDPHELRDRAQALLSPRPPGGTGR